MADTIISNTPGPSSDSGAGWVVALILLLAMVVGAVVLYQKGYFNMNNEKKSTTNINVTLPTPSDATPAPAN
ncbi:MAG: hypothetical protein H7282_10955 [Cytophagaceae bacterium]|nr:hypothetical protein [Cytophagaceae bacterium]